MSVERKILYFTAEPYPTFRVDVAVLFGKSLPRHGICSDVVTIAAGTEAAAQPAWAAGRAIVCPAARGRTAGYLAQGLHAVTTALRVDAAGYAAFQARDLPIVSPLLLLIARLRRVPFFYWMSYPMPEGHVALARERGLSSGLLKYLFPLVRGHLGRLLLYRLVLPFADHVFVQSPQMKADLVALGLDPAKLTPVPMGIDCELLESQRAGTADSAPDAAETSLVYLGSLDRPRRIELLFPMLRRLQQEFPGIRLTLVGDTGDADHRAWLRQQADASGVGDRVSWTGWLPMAEAWRHVRAARVGLSPFPRGPLLDSASPTKLPEYIALGVPTVGNPNPDQRQVIEGSGGGLCVEYTAEAFADAVAELLRMSPASLARRMAQAGEWVRKHRDYAAIARSLSQRYHELLPAPACSTEAPAP